MKPNKAFKIIFIENSGKIEKILTDRKYLNRYLGLIYNNQYSKLLEQKEIPIDGIELFQVKQNGQLLYIGTNDECWYWLHDHQGQSWDWALKYSGYSVEEFQ